MNYACARILLLSSGLVVGGCGQSRASTGEVVSSSLAVSAAPAEAGPTKTQVTKLVFIDKKEACDCTRARVTKSWDALQAALGGKSTPSVERLYMDAQPDQVRPYREMRPMMAVPALYFLSTAPRKSVVAEKLARGLEGWQLGVMGAVRGLEVVLSAEERGELERQSRMQAGAIRDVERARIILAVAEHGNITRAASELRLTRDTVRKWAKRFLHRRLEGLHDDPRSGRPPRFSPGGCDVRDQTRMRAA